jgi:shikimate kinase
MSSDIILVDSIGAGKSTVGEPLAVLASSSTMLNE